MGVFDAKKNGISYRDEGRITLYKVICNQCNSFFEHNRYNSSNAHTYICGRCKENSKVAEDLYLKVRKEERFERAVERIEKMVEITQDYKVAINRANKYLHKKGWFQSTEEIMVAIELLKNKVKTIHQQKINRYTVDFVLPDKKIILEVDGDIFHSDLEREGKRDANILFAMGLDWYVVRIPTAKVNKDITKLMEEIEKIKMLQMKR